MPGAEESTQRLRTASAVGALLDAVGEASSDQEVVAAVARVEWPSSAAAAKRSLESAARVVGAIQEAHWDVLRRLADATDERRDRARSLLGRLSEAWIRDGLGLARHGAAGCGAAGCRPADSHAATPAAVCGRQERTVPASEVNGVLDEIRAAADQAREGRIAITWVVEE